MSNKPKSETAPREFTCEQCGEPMQSKRAHKRYCGQRCKWIAWDKRNPRRRKKLPRRRKVVEP